MILAPQTTPEHILLVEDESDLAAVIVDRLRASGYAVTAVADGETALVCLGQGAFDLVILDLMLPGRTGFDVCREIRRQGNEVPVLMVTARTQIADKILGLRLGADDYLTKPFDILELLARIEARLRRQRPIESASDVSDRHRFGLVEVDFRRADVRVEGRSVSLSAKEFHLLRFLITRAGDVLSRDQILDAVWGADSSPGTRTVDVHVAALRRKLEQNPALPQHILTVHGLGYKFVSIA